ncbi:hypothetical protein B0A49_10040 [Cryomyces minteri]|uniref:Uncharacterized protein n=1 Tax=Cryomyces minteri TaxID=331657 RepID=A0A4U0WX46_9PEZI|nr:hypothetical protein B0A49_12290 [Cryomyces minteri]TKA66385.1 hypothetical protein B0A49_10040 [Cryomyces minteri]
MDSLKGLAKGGWHPPGKDGKKESWRGDFKGVNTVAGWMGKGKDPHEEARQHHVAAPLSTLKDPAQFAPPPKHISYHGGVAAVPTTTTLGRNGLGAPLSVEESRAKQEAEMAVAMAAEEANRPPSPPKPYRVDTTGLSTANLPKPPVRRPNQSAVSPPLPHSASASAKKPKPALPPRLPPRQNSHPDAYALPPPPTYTETAQKPTQQEYLNQGALDRLGQAGVSVPGFNIGRNASPHVPLRSGPSSPAISQAPAGSNTRAPQLNELQSRFSKMSTASSPTSETPSQGTSWAQKQAALKTASSFRNDPSSVSLSDARNAASTANNFRERHGEQVASGWRAASGLNQKFGISDKVNSYTSGGTSASPVRQNALAPPPPVQGLSSAAAGKKAPPAPPSKKAELAGGVAEPPPIPLSSKPRV